jgi:hypothetical protein
MVVNDVNELSQADSQILHPGTRALFRYWETIRAEQAAPNRSMLDLRQIKQLMPNLTIIERDHMRGGFRWRLAGSAVSDIYRQALTGTDALARWDSFERATVQTLYANAVTGPQPCLLRFRLVTELGDVIGVEQIGLPLVGKNHAQMHVFGGIFSFTELRDLSHQRIEHVELASARMIWTEHLPGDQLVARLRRVQKPGLTVVPGGRSD